MLLHLEITGAQVLVLKLRNAIALDITLLTLSVLMFTEFVQKLIDLALALGVLLFIKLLEGTVADPSALVVPPAHTLENLLLGLVIHEGPEDQKCDAVRI